jgi:TetR/AcrR family transcriptional repressor of nem operon
MTSATRDHLLDAAEALVRSRGYAAFSYADIAGTVGISKPSIHHHFPTKEDLGVALVASYTDRFDARLAAILEASSAGPARLRAYADLYLEGLRDERACLCAMLASDHAAVPERVRIGVAAFMERNVRWLARVVADGQGQGEFATALAPRTEAETLYAALMGAMFAARSLGRLDAFQAVAARSIERLGVCAG